MQGKITIFRNWKGCVIQNQNVPVFTSVQSGFQSGPETAPLAAVSAGYCHFLSPVQARSNTCTVIFQKRFCMYQEFFHFTYKLFIFNKI